MADSSSENRYFSFNTDVRGHFLSFLIRRNFPGRKVNAICECVMYAHPDHRRTRCCALILEKDEWVVRQVILLFARDDHRLLNSGKQWQGQISSLLLLAIQISRGL